MNPTVFTNSKRRPAVAWISSIACIFYAALATFFVPFSPIITGLDPSWMYGLNRLAGSKYVFGKDVAFTYGPLGFLINPMDVGSSLAIAIVFWVSFQICLFALIAWRFQRQPARLLAFCGIYVLLTGYGLWTEHRLLCFIGVLILLSLHSARSEWLAATAGFFSFVGSEIKWSIGVSAFAMLGVSWMLLLGKQRRGAIHVILAGIGGSGIALIASLALFHSPSNLIEWILLSANLTAGYSSTMSLDGPIAVRLLAGLNAAILVVLYFSQTRSSRRFLLIWIGPVFLAFKEGFVRQGGQSFAYFATVTLSLLLLLLVPEIRDHDARGLGYAIAATFAVGVVYACNYESYPALRWSEFRDLLLLRRAAEAIKEIAHLPATRRALRSASAVNLEGSMLPAAWKARLESPQARTSILPWELSIAAANQMQWQPIPTLQLYAAFTPALDLATAKRIRESGPEFLIVTYEDIDGRNLILDTPETWRRVLGQYEVSESDLPHRRILLRRKQASDEALTELSAGRASMNDWVRLPGTKRLVFAALYLRYSFMGLLSDLFYHVPATYLACERKSGRTDQYRLMTKNAAGGMLINYLPVDQGGFEDLFRGYGDDPIVRFRVLSAGGGGYLQRDYSWRLRSSSVEMRQRGGVAEPPTITTISAPGGRGEDALVDVTSVDLNGSRYIKFLQILVSTELNGANACYVSYEIRENRLWLIADKGSGAAGQGAPGQEAVLNNSQCSIALSGVEARFEANALSLRVPMKFRSSFRGSKRILAYAVDQRARHSEWKSGGSWEVQ